MRCYGTIKTNLLQLSKEHSIKQPVRIAAFIFETPSGQEFSIDFDENETGCHADGNLDFRLKGLCYDWMDTWEELDEFKNDDDESFDLEAFENDIEFFRGVRIKGISLELDECWPENEFTDKWYKEGFEKITFELSELGLQIQETDIEYDCSNVAVDTF